MRLQSGLKLASVLKINKDGWINHTLRGVWTVTAGAPCGSRREGRWQWRRWVTRQSRASHHFCNCQLSLPSKAPPGTLCGKEACEVQRKVVRFYFYCHRTGNKDGGLEMTPEVLRGGLTRVVGSPPCPPRVAVWTPGSQFPLHWLFQCKEQILTLNSPAQKWANRGLSFTAG